MKSSTKTYFKTFYQSMVASNFLFLGLSAVTLLYSIFCHLNLLLSDEKNLPYLIANFSTYKVFYWALNYVFFLMFILGPLYRSKAAPGGNKRYWYTLGVLALPLFLLLFSLAPWIVNEQGEVNGLVAIAITTAVVITGWFVQHQITLQNNRTSHTLNLLLQMRLSDEFQSNYRAVSDIYPRTTHKVIPQADVELFFAKTTEQRKSLAEDKATAITGQIYLLNYYEFLAYGIYSRNLDGELLYQTQAGVIMGTFDKSEHIVAHLQALQPKAYKSLIDLLDSWDERYKTESNLLADQTAKDSNKGE